MNLLITTSALNVFEHMALDEVLVHSRAGESTLRFYNWTEISAVTFGYAQFISEVRRGLQANSFGGDVCRRPTGGGVVYHQDDLTFSLIFPSQERPAEIYKQLHGTVHAALTLSGLSAQVFDQKLPASAYAPSQRHTASACFVNPVENDLLLPNGQKMLGGAIRRFGTTILYQGSLQVPGARHNPAYKQALIQAVRSFLNSDLQIGPARAEWLTQAQQLAKTQYNTLGWTEKF
ncbi:MAG: hypothetical protein IJ876_01590 [Elusimicrobiaceae bacterium]|nr:hypothetical protein [Elusimicrobiaceae bacterium]